MKPHGALSKEELLALVKPGQIIYKVYHYFNGLTNDGVGYISHVVCEDQVSDSKIFTTESKKTIYLRNWFEKTYGYLFNNYFHALAYSLKLKADHGKAQSKERTGVEGAA